MLKFSTSLICCDLSDIKSDLDTLLDLPDEFHYLHADFMDGQFVPRYGISPELIQWIKKRYGQNFEIDSHLMTKTPTEYINAIAPSSAEITFHVEAVTDPLRVYQMIHDFGGYYDKEIFFGTNVFTDLFPIYEAVENVRARKNFLFMGISPGVLGSKSFPNHVYHNLNILNENASKYNVIIDGGVNFESIKMYKKFASVAKCIKCVCGNSTIFHQTEDTANLSRKELIRHNASKILKSMENN